MQPRRVYLAAGFPGIHDEARAEHAVLHPAHEELGIGHRTGKPSDVVTGVEHAGQAHGQAHAQVPTQRMPARGVVA